MSSKSEVKSCKHVKYLEMLIWIVTDAERSSHAFIDALAHQSGVDGQLLVWIDQQKNVPDVGL